MPGWWVTDILNNPGLNGPVVVVSWLVWVVFSIVMHELAHGWMAIRLGDDTPRWTGHMTWNPVVHMGMFSLIMLAVLGIAWGAMPYDPSRVRGRYGEALIAVAGPVMNVLILIVCILLGGLVVALGGRIPSPLDENLAQFFLFGAMLNTVLALFNMVPVPPLDGGKVASVIVPAYGRIFVSENGQWVGLGVFLLAFFFLFDYLFQIGFAVAGVGIGVVDAMLSAVIP